MTIKLLNWFFLFLLLAAAFILGQVTRQALGAAYDPFVTRLEMIFGVHPGGLIPVDTRAPDIRLQYLGARSVGQGDYDIRIRRVR